MLTVYYMRQVNGMNLADIMFFLVTLCSVQMVCVGGQQCIRHSMLIAFFCSNMVKAMDLIFDIHVPRDSPEMTP